MSKTRDHVEMEKRCREAAKLFAQEYPAPEVARRLGVARQMAYRWRSDWGKGGLAALASKGPAGRKPKLTVEQAQQVTTALLAGPEAAGYKTALWTLPRVAALIQELTGVRYHPGHVWRLLGASGFSCQRPERRALERDERAIGHWKRVRGPALKKGPPAVPHSCFYRRKWIEYSSDPRAHLGLARTNARAARVLQLEKPFHRGRPDALALLFPDPPRQHQKPLVLCNR